jgi:hypothetical protein
MCRDIRKMIDKVNNFKPSLYESIGKPYTYFLRWTSDPESDLKRNFSGHLQAWFHSEKEAMNDYNNRILDGAYIPYEPKKDITTGMWNSEPEWGLSGYEFNDEKTFDKSISQINDIAWYHSESLQQDLVVFRSSNYILGDGFDGEDVFRDADMYWYIEPYMNYNEVMDIITKDDVNSELDERIINVYKTKNPITTLGMF